MFLQIATALAIAPDVDEVEAVAASAFAAEDDIELSFKNGEEVFALAPWTHHALWTNAL